VANQLTLLWVRLRSRVLLGLALRLCDVRRCIRASSKAPVCWNSIGTSTLSFWGQACVRALVQLPRGLSFGGFGQQFAHVVNHGLQRHGFEVLNPGAEDLIVLVASHGKAVPMLLDLLGAGEIDAFETTL
jgi:hypothetical protein